MENKEFSFPNLCKVKKIQSLKLPFVKQIRNKKFPNTYFLNHEFDGLGVMSIEASDSNRWNSSYAIRVKLID